MSVSTFWGESPTVLSRAFRCHWVSQLTPRHTAWMCFLIQGTVVCFFEFLRLGEGLCKSKSIICSHWLWWNLTHSFANSLGPSTPLDRSSPYDGPQCALHNSRVCQHPELEPNFFSSPKPGAIPAVVLLLFRAAWALGPRLSKALEESSPVQQGTFVIGGEGVMGDIVRAPAARGFTSDPLEGKGRQTQRM